MLLERTESGQQSNSAWYECPLCGKVRLTCSKTSLIAAQQSGLADGNQHPENHTWGHHTLGLYVEPHLYNDAESAVGDHQSQALGPAYTELDTDSSDTHPVASDRSAIPELAEPHYSWIW